MKGFLHAVLLALLTSVMLAQGAAFRARNGVTYDETFFLSTGLLAYRSGDFRLLPPEITSPLPILAAYWAASVDSRADVRFAKMSASSAREPEWEGHEEDLALITRARLANLLLVTVPLMWLIYVWLARTEGALPAVLGAGMFAFSPTVVAHGSLATTDTCFTFASLACVAALVRYARRPSGLSFAIATALLGVALAAKYSALFLVPVAAAVCTAAAIRSRRSQAPRPGRLTLIVLRNMFLLGSGSFLVWWASHAFSLSPPDASLAAALDHGWFGSLQSWLAMHWRPAPVAGLQYLPGGVEAVQSGFLAGAHSSQGWWYCFAVAFLLKSTLAELLLAVAAIVSSIVLLTRGARFDWLGRSGLLALSFVAFAIFAARTPLNIGQRHILPLYAIMFLLGPICLARVLASRPAMMAGAAALFLIVQVATTVPIAARALSYFNPIAGGPENGYKYLVDSNIDWGQDLPYVADTLRGCQCGDSVLVYFGTAFVPPPSLQRGDQARLESPDCIAISLTLLQGAHLPDDVYQALRGVPARDRVGDSIQVYDARDEAVGRAWRSALAAGARDHLSRTSIVRPADR